MNLPSPILTGVAHAAELPGNSVASLLRMVGDNTGLARPGVFGQAMTQVSWMHPEFVIAIGDLIEGYTDDKAMIGLTYRGMRHGPAAVMEKGPRAGTRRSRY